MKALVIAVALVIVTGLCMTVFSACGKTYRVDYSGSKSDFKNARDRYRAGQKVRLIYYIIATDTDYSFYVDGERVSPGYENDCYILEFVMPEHDVVINVESRNSMEALESRKVDYCGQMDDYLNAEETCFVGYYVELYLKEKKDDTVYHFYLDDEEIPCEITDEGYVMVSFIMPDHDCTLKYTEE